MWILFIIFHGCLFDLEVCIWIEDSDFVPKNGFTWEKPDKYRLKGIGVQKNQSFWNFQSTVNFVICIVQFLLIQWRRIILWDCTFKCNFSGFDPVSRFASGGAIGNNLIFFIKLLCLPLIHRNEFLSQTLNSLHIDSKSFLLFLSILSSFWCLLANFYFYGSTISSSHTELKIISEINWILSWLDGKEWYTNS